MPQQQKEIISIRKKPYGKWPQKNISTIKDNIIDSIRRPAPVLEQKPLEGTTQQIIDAFENNLELVEQAARKATLGVYLELGKAMTKNTQIKDKIIRYQGTTAEQIYKILDEDVICYSRTIMA